MIWVILTFLSNFGFAVLWLPLWYCECSTVIHLQESDQGAAHALDDNIQSQSLYESPAFRVSREGLEELLAEVRRVDALITTKPPGHPVSGAAQLHTLTFMLFKCIDCLAFGCTMRRQCSA